jgi:hypothetical protein
MTTKFDVETELGDSLNNFSKLQTLESDDAEDLTNQIRQIKFPIAIVQIVAKGTRFYCFFNATRIVKKKIK